MALSTALDQYERICHEALGLIKIYNSKTGLCDSHARNRKKIHFAFNASLSSENVAKVLLHETGNVIPMAWLKSLMVNQYMVARIISRSPVGRT